MSLNLKKNTFRNDMYNFIRASIISFYSKCIQSDQKYYQDYLSNGDNVIDYLKFFEKLYCSYYKDKE